MANLEREGFREILPTLKVSDLKGAKETVLTLAKAPEIVQGFTKGKNQREKLLLMRFREFPEKVWYPNQTSIARLMKVLGKETENMVGERVPIVVEETQNPETRAEVEALFIARESQWKQLLMEFDAEEINDAKTKKTRKRRS